MMWWGNRKTSIFPGNISECERKVREPPLVVPWRYARAIDLPMDVLVDDVAELPEQFVNAVRNRTAEYERRRKEAGRVRKQSKVTVKTRDQRLCSASAWVTKVAVVIGGALEAVLIRLIRSLERTASLCRRDYHLAIFQQTGGMLYSLLLVFHARNRV